MVIKGQHLLYEFGHHMTSFTLSLSLSYNTKILILIQGHNFLPGNDEHTIFRVISHEKKFLV